MNKQIEALKMAVEELHNALKLLQRFTPQSVGDGSWTAWTVGLKNQLSDLQHTLYNNGFVEGIQACKEALAEAEKQDDIEKQLDYAHARGFKEGAENAYKKMEQPVCSKCGKPTQQGQCFYGCRQEQPAQEPVALIRHENGNFSHAPSWQSLSDGEIGKVLDDLDIGAAHTDWMINFAYAIEAKLKEKSHA